MNARYFLILTLFILMLPAFCFIVGRQFINVYIPFVIISTAFLFFKKNKSYINNIKLLVKHTPYKYFNLFIIFSVFSILMSICFGQFFFGGFITSTIGGLICSVILPFLFSSFSFRKIFSYNFLLKFLFGFAFFAFVYAIIDCLVIYLDIHFIKSIITILTNKRSLIFNFDATSRDFLLRATSFPRACSIFEEPAYFGYFIFLISPIVYEIKYNIPNVFKNQILDKVVRTSIIPLMWISLFLTQSPIFLVFNLLFSAFYFILKRNIITKIFENKFLLFSILVPLLSLIIYAVLYIDFKNTYIYRVILVLQNINNLETFVVVEPSLATRLIAFIAGLKLFAQNWFLGVGYGNMSYLIADIIIKLNLPLPYELNRLFLSDNTHICSTIFSKITTELGILGTLIFYYFTFRTFVVVRKIKNLTSIHSLQAIMQGFEYFVLLFILTSVYDSNLNQAWCWIIFGMIYACIVKLLTNKNLIKNHDKKG